MDKKITKKKERLKSRKVFIDWFRGSVISGATVIEGALGWRLRTYFFPKTNRQASIFYWNIVNTPYFSFDKKISLYEQIPYFKKSKKYTRVKSALRFIQKLRNAVAHWELDEKMGNENEVVIYNPVTLKSLKLDAELMGEFEKDEKFLLKTFGWKQTLKEKYLIQGTPSRGGQAIPNSAISPSRMNLPK